MFILKHCSKTYDMKLIGVFSSYNEVERLVDIYKLKEGFKDNPKGFIIYDIPMLEACETEKNQTLYLLQLIKIDEDDGYDEDVVKCYGFFCNGESAKRYIVENKINCKKGETIDIQEVLLDVSFWEDGFITIDE